MSKVESISRQQLIIKRLIKRPATFEEIFSSLKQESEFQERNLIMSKRTFQRDVSEILSMYGIEIVYDRSERKYKLIENENIDVGNRILETFDMFNTLKMGDRMLEYLQFEKRKPQGTEHIQSILKIIKKRNVLQFEHQKFWEDKETTRQVEPYLVKEVKNRWYLVAKDLKDGIVKTFGLDRMQSLKLTSKKFQYPNKEVLKNKFHNFFGVITPLNKEPQNILLSFTSDQAKYVKTLPWHHSQKIVEDNEKECIISFYLFPTYDFVQEILSNGSNVKVLEPQSLKEEINRILDKTLKLY